MLSTSDFELTTNQKELLSNKSEKFPYICNHDSCAIGETKHFTWHWHPSFEIDYVQQGEIIIQTTDTTTHLKQGEAIFINSNVMHDIKYLSTEGKCDIYGNVK